MLSRARLEGSEPDTDSPGLTGEHLLHHRCAAGQRTPGVDQMRNGERGYWPSRRVPIASRSRNAQREPRLIFKRVRRWPLWSAGGDFVVAASPPTSPS